MIIEFLDSIWVGLIVAVLGGMVSPLVVIRRFSNLTGSISHASFAGIGVAMMWQFNPLMGAIFASLISAWVMQWVQSKTKDHMDTLLAMIWVVGMAIGLLLLHFKNGYTTDLFGFLFGNIVMVTQSDTILMAIWTSVIAFGLLFFYQLIQLVSLDPDYAAIRRIPVKWVNIVLVSILAVTTVLLSKVVGILLVMAVLTIPGAIARLFAARLVTMIALSTMVSLISVGAGLLLTYFINLPTGPVIILLLVAAYLLGMGIQYWRQVLI